MDTPRPQDFASEQPPERIIGTESECNIQLPEGIHPGKYITLEAIMKAGYRAASSKEGTSSSFLNNGMRFYVDIGSHIEICTAEALGPRQAAAADRAGILVLQDVVAASGKEHFGIYRFSGTSIGNESATCGYHENYLTPREATFSPYFDQVVSSHLASRSWAMSGSLNSRLLLSQKAKGIGGEPVARDYNRRVSVGNKPMAIVPTSFVDSTTMGNVDDWARLEVRYADAGLSLTAKYLSFATTSLVLRLIEQEPGQELDYLSDLAFKKPVDAANRFNGDLGFFVTAETVGGAYISALDYQEALADACSYLAENTELPEDEVEAINLWHSVIDRLNSVDPSTIDFKELLSTLDFAPRFRYLLRKFPLTELHSHNPEAVEANLTWDRIMPNGGGMTYWSKIPSKHVSQDEVERLKVVAPPTRASLRSELIHEAVDQGHTSAFWAHVTVDNHKINLLNPYLSTLDY